MKKEVIHIKNKVLMMWILVLLMICCTVSFVSASTPDFTVNENLGEGDYDNVLVNGVNDVGEIIITAAPFISDVYNVSSFNENKVYQQHDRLLWLGNTSVSVKNPFNAETAVPPGGQYYFSMIGAYSVTSLLNSSQSFVITIQNPDVNNVYVQSTYLPNGFEMNFTPNSFVLTSERVVDTTITVDDDVSPGDYVVNYTVNDKKFSEEFEVVTNKEWEIIEEEVDYAVIAKSGDNFYLGHLELENVGNDNIEITISKSGIGNFLVTTPKPQTLYKKQTLRIDFQLQVPTTQSIGKYEVIVDIVGGLNYTRKQFNITIEDSILPTIETINFSSDKAQTNIDITVIAEDNNDVINMTMEYEGKKLFMKKDNQKFSVVELFPNTKKYEITFCAIDASNNKYCESINKTFVKSSIIKGLKTRMTMPTMKVGKYSTIVLFNLTERIPEGITITLVDFVSTASDVRNDSRTIRIIDGDESVERFTLASNTIKIYEKGEIKLEIRSEEISEFTGTLSFETPSHIEEVSDVIFNVDFKDYDIPQDFTKTWNSFTDLICRVIDTGDLKTSKRECSFYVPIDVSEDEISIPTTVEEREGFRKEAIVVQSELDKTKRRSALFITLLIVIILLLLTFAWFMITQYPYMRYTTGSKAREKYSIEKGEML